MSSEPNATEQTPEAEPEISRGYANYALFVLVIVYVFNFIDRNIVSILAEELKVALDINDAQIGFLYGTAFAVFYAIFGIPLGRLADMWNRKKLISIGLFFWSGMTAMCGLAKTFGSFATFRIGVGIGEASASPAAFSMLGDYFPPRLRATAVAIYSSGVYIGAGIGIVIGGLVVGNWNRAFPDGGPFGLVGWQAAFMVVGLPGLLMSLWVWTLREPRRGASEGLETEDQGNALPEFLRELAAVLPPIAMQSLTPGGVQMPRLITNVLIGLGLSVAAWFGAAAMPDVGTWIWLGAGALYVLASWRQATAAGGGKKVTNNLLILLGCALGAWILTATVGSMVQWVALGIGLYAFFTWTQGLEIRDNAAFSMIYKSRTIVFGMIGFGWMAFVGYGLGFWAPSFFRRVHGVSQEEAGVVLGVSAAIAGLIGVASGGFLSDWWRARNPRARVYLGILGSVLSIPAGLVVLTTSSLTVAYVANFLFNALSSFWIGSAVALVNELVMPRMRATASSFYVLVMTFIGLALGPFSMGQVSVRLSASGMDDAEALKRSLILFMGTYLLAILFLWLASRHVVEEESSRLDRARAYGEAV